MNINSTQRSPRTPAAKPSTPSPPKKDAMEKIGDAVAADPLRAIADVADIGISTPLALGMNLGNGSELMKGAGVVLGGIHGVSAAFNFVSALESVDAGNTTKAKKHTILGIGEALAATGVVASVLGAGPVSLGFVGAGALIATLVPKP